MSRSLKNDESWALELLDPLSIKRYPSGYNVEIPPSDPPDCVLVPNDPNDSETRIEFSALGPQKLFEFYATALKEKEPFFAEIRIPYEPEAWLKEVLDRKNFLKDTRYDILCTHFCTHYTLPGFDKRAHHKDQTLNPFVLTNDMLYRFISTAWDVAQGTNKEKAIVLVHPENQPERLLPLASPPVPKVIDTSEGYPTIQFLITNFPVNKPIKWNNIKNISPSFKPYNSKWVVPDRFRIRKIEEGITYSIVDKTDGSERIIDGTLIFEVKGASMPNLKFKD